MFDSSSFGAVNNDDFGIYIFSAPSPSLSFISVFSIFMSLFC